MINMANIFGTLNGLRLAGEATATGSTDMEAFLIIWALSVVACVSVGVSVAKVLEPSTDAESAPWIYGGIAAIATILATMATLMLWMLKH